VVLCEKRDEKERSAAPAENGRSQPYVIAKVPPRAKKKRLLGGEKRGGVAFFLPGGKVDYTAPEALHCTESIPGKDEARLPANAKGK